MRYFIFLYLLIPFWSSAQNGFGSQEIVIDSSEFESYYMESFIPFYYQGAWCMYNLNQDTPDTTYHFDAWLPSKEDIGLYVFRNDDKYGALGSFGDTIYPFEYDSIQYLANGIARMKDGIWYLEKFDLKVNLQYDGEWEISQVNREFQQESYEYALELDSIRTHNEFDYLYKDGKVGVYYQSYLIVPIAYEAVQPLNFNRLFSKQQKAFLAFDGEQFRFFDLYGEDLLQTATSDFQLMHYDFLKYWDGSWKYFNFKTKLKFDSKGNDVVLYNNSSYKLYSANHENPTLYVFENQISGAEDYFPLPLVGKHGVSTSTIYLAYRKAGKIGVMDNNGQKIIAPKYDRVEAINDRAGHFKFFKGDYCGLLNQNGLEGFAAEYANIIATENPTRFIVLKNKKTGVVDQNGKIIVPLEYDYIDYEQDCFFLRRSNLIGLASLGGEVIFEPTFRGYHTFNDPDDPNFFAIVFQRFSGQLQLASRTGRLTDQTFDSYNYGNRVFKLYRAENIEVISLNENSIVEDRIIYDNVKSLRVSQNEFDKIFYGLGNWPTSYLEENQQNGLFGLRYFQKPGLAVTPTYKYVQENSMYSYFGEKEVSNEQLKLTDNLSIDFRNTYDQMYLGSDKVEHSNLVSAESVVHFQCTQSTANALVFDENLSGEVEVYHHTTPYRPSEMDTMKINYGHRYDDTKPKKIVLNAKAVICPIDHAEFSLFEYYSYFSNLGALKLTKQTAALIMNPNIGIKFEGGKRRIQNETPDLVNYKQLQFSPYKDFKDWYFSDQLTCFISKSEIDTSKWSVRDFQWDKQSKPNSSQESLSFSSKVNGIALELELTQKGNNSYKVNADFPDFSFTQTDSLGIEYHAGRIIVGRYGMKRMIDPDRKVYLDSIEDIKYLGESFFAVQNGQEWHVVDRNAQRISNRSFETVSSVINGTFNGRKENVRGIYKTDGTVLLESEKGLDYMTENKYRVNRSPEVWYDVESKKYDTIQNQESYLGADVILERKQDGVYHVRQFGSKKVISIHSDNNPKLYNNHLLFNKKKDLYICQLQGDIIRYKKASSPKEVGDFTTILGKKERILFNSEGDEIARADLSTTVSDSRDGLVVSASDTNYLLLQSGQTTTYPPTLKVVSEKDPNDYSVFYQGGNYGLKRGDEVIVEPIYTSLNSIGFGDFNCSKEYEVNLYDSQLQRVNQIPYDYYYFVTSEILAIELNENWFFYRFTVDGWQPFR